MKPEVPNNLIPGEVEVQDYLEAALLIVSAGQSNITFFLSTVDTDSYFGADLTDAACCRMVTL